MSSSAAIRLRSIAGSRARTPSVSHRSHMSATSAAISLRWTSSAVQEGPAEVAEGVHPEVAPQEVVTEVARPYVSEHQLDRPLDHP